MNEFEYNGPLNQWQGDIVEHEEGIETCYYGKYFFKIDERLYYIDLRCRNNDTVYDIFFRIFTHFKTGELFHEDIFTENMYGMEDKALSTREFRLLCEEFAEGSDEIIEIEERIKKLENGRKLLTDEEWDKMNVGAYKTHEDYEPWIMIDECGKEFKNERFVLTAQPCYECGSPVIKSKFCTPSDTWEHLAGREGWIFFCPNCKKQLQENITIMN